MGCGSSSTKTTSAPTQAGEKPKHVESQGRLLKCKKTEVVAVKGGNDPPYQLRFAYVSQRGYYPDDLEKENQDSFAVHPNFDNNTNVHMFGVFDGHGQNGTPCSHYARDNVPEQIKKRMKNPKMDFADAYAGAFPATNLGMHSACDDLLSGTTAIVATIIGRKLYVANVGDSRAVMAERIGNKLVAVDLSVDQTPFRKDELERVKRCGARVLSAEQLAGRRDPFLEDWGAEGDDDGDPPRLWLPDATFPGTAFTRSLGDKIAESIGVCADPEVLMRELTPRDKFVVIASDGVFEFLPSQAVVEMVSKFNDPLEAAVHVASESYRLWLQYEVRSDDITIIIIVLEGLENEAEKSSSTTSPANDKQQPSPQMRGQSFVAQDPSHPSASANRPVRRGMSVAKRNIIASTQDDEEDEEPFVVPLNLPRKKPEDERRLMEAVKANFLFSHLTSEKRQTVFSLMDKMFVHEGQVIIKQGERGDKFYVVLRGDFDVFLTQKDGDNAGKQIHIHTYTSKFGTTSPCFGELALMYGKPRAATVIAKTDGELWSLDRKAFRAVLMKSPNKILVKILHSVPVLSSLTVSQLQRLADVLTEATFKTGDYIIRQGDKGEAFYVINQGEARCTLKKNLADASEEPMEVLRLQKGQYFGERALLNDAPRAANVIAINEVKCLQIGREAFEEVLGPLQHLIDEDRRLREEVSAAAVKVGVLGTTLADLKWVATLHVGETGHSGMVEHTNGKRLTLKVESKKKLGAIGAQDRAVMEKKTQLKLSSARVRCVPEVLCTFQDDTSLYILLNGRLAGGLHELGAKLELDESLARIYVAYLITFLDGIHQQQMVFRALRPDTIRVNDQGLPCIIDFELTKKLESGQTFTLCGSPEYLAPEQIRGTGHGLAVDFWQLGILMYEMLEGKTPFGGEKMDEMRLYQKITEFKGNLEFPSHFSAEAADLISKLLTPEPLQRLGAGPHGIETVKKHAWFGKVDWAKVMDGALLFPPAVSPAIDDVFNEASKTEQPHYENFTKEDLYFKDF